MKLVYTHLPGPDGPVSVCACEENGRIMELYFPEAQASLKGNIYVGQIVNLAPQMNGAFVLFGDHQKGYLPLDSHPDRIIRADGQAVAPGQSERPLRPGDCILVQVKADAIKGKPPRLTGGLSIAGRTLVFDCARSGVSISSKLSETERKELRRRWRKLTAPDLPAPEASSGRSAAPGYGIIVRTNAASASNQELLEELEQYGGLFERILVQGRTRTPGSLLYRPAGTNVRILQDVREDELEEVVTDSKEVLQELTDYLHAHHRSAENLLRYYEDPLLPLYALHSIQKAVEERQKEKIWLSSGGFLVIQQTEAFVCIDVNTGKFTGRRKAGEAFRRLNLEAAGEIARQIRLRNLTGIILVDFINMENPDHRSELADVMKKLVRRDHVPCQVVDITPLGIMELTRKK